MIRKLKKGTVIKEIENETLVADYIAAGWTIVEDKISKRKFE